MDPQRSRGPPSASPSQGRGVDDEDAATVLTTLPDGTAVKRPDPLSVYMYTELHNSNKANADAPKPESTDDLASVVSRVRQGRPSHHHAPWRAPSEGIPEERRSSAGGSSHGQGADWGGMAPYGQFMSGVPPPMGTRSPSASASTLHRSSISSSRSSKHRGSYQSSVSLGRHGEPPYTEPPTVTRPLVPNPGKQGFFDDLVSKNNTHVAASESSLATEESEDDESVVQEDIVQRSRGPPTAKKGSKENANSRIRREKQAYLIELDAMKLNGISLSREFTMDDMLDEITFEYVRHSRNEEAREAVATMKQYVLYFVAGVLVVNHFAKIFDLTGWTEAVQSKLEDPATRPLLHRLYRKWFRRGPPNEEMQLVFMIGGSLITTHLMNKGLNSLAGTDAAKAAPTTPVAPAMFGGQGGGNGLGLGSIMSLLGGLGGGNGAGGGIGDLLGSIFTGDAAPKPAQPPPPPTNTTARAPMAPPAL